MVFKIIKEVLILLISLSVFPAIVVGLLTYSDSAMSGVRIREFTSHISNFWIHIILPYLGIQAIRAAMWAERSLVGRKIANMYFALLALGVGAWSFTKVWDLFYFMYALGDMPQELRQLMELEFNNILITIVALIVAVHSFRIFMNPERRRRPKNRTRY